jgi:Xaa-Pro aminopeptidase
VHDVGDYKIGDEWRVLEPGMALTVEPGIYIPAGARGVSKRWHNIGIRIEDDVLVTRTGAEVLTAEAPKEIKAIEAVMAAG